MAVTAAPRSRFANRSQEWEECPMVRIVGASLKRQNTVLLKTSIPHQISIEYVRDGSLRCSGNGLNPTLPASPDTPIIVGHARVLRGMRMVTVRLPVNFVKGKRVARPKSFRRNIH